MSELKLKPMSEIKAELGVSRRKSRRLSIDFGLFRNSLNEINCSLNTVWLSFGAARIKHCDHLNRLISGLKYYSNLEIGSNVVDKDEFNKFFDDIYTNMIDDYLHVLEIHATDFEEIYNSLSIKYHMNMCLIKNCVFTRRHFQKKCDDDPWINFYIQQYDSLHFLLFHIFSVGLRSFRNDLKIESRKELEEKEFDNMPVCYDIKLDKMINILNIKKKNTSFLQRYNYVNKYDLNINLKFDYHGNISQHKSIDSERSTFKDSLMFHLQKKIKQKKIKKKNCVCVNGWKKKRKIRRGKL
eukprot:6605_1